MRNISIIGTVGVPANYGGFETLAENLVRYHDAASIPVALTVYCSSKSYSSESSHFLSARLKYIPLSANGVQSIPYDIASLFLAMWNRCDVILLLGVSGSIFLPFVRLFSSAHIIVNIDGIEWRREKWSGWAKRFLRFSEKLAVKFSHVVVVDNDAIEKYVWESYGVKTHVIVYGGDHCVAVNDSVEGIVLPDHFAFSVCRIEPENNVHLITEAFSRLPTQALVMVGNWDGSDYGKSIRKRYAGHANLFLLDSIYDLGKLKIIRSRASFYIHGHSAGGTNPSLVEAMHFEKAVLAFDCDYNRVTTESKALFFSDVGSLCSLTQSLSPHVIERIGGDMKEIANRRYMWSIVAEQYFSLF